MKSSQFYVFNNNSQLIPWHLNFGQDLHYTLLIHLIIKYEKSDKPQANTL